jgi:hypothetical protein
MDSFQVGLKNICKPWNEPLTVPKAAGKIFPPCKALYGETFKVGKDDGADL